MPDPPGYAFYDFPREAFPVKVELLDTATRELRWAETVPEPGALRIPGSDESNEGAPVSVRLTFGDGQVVEVDPDD